MSMIRHGIWITYPTLRDGGTRWQSSLRFDDPDCWPAGSKRVHPDAPPPAPPVVVVVGST